MNKITSSRKAILKALLNGDRLTAFDANKIGNTEQTIRQTLQIIGDEFFGEEEGKVYTFYELDDGRIVNEDRIISLIEDV